MKFLKTKFLYTAVLMLTFAFVGCDEQDVATGSSLSNYVGLESTKYVGLHAGESTTVQSKIYATEATNTDRVFALSALPVAAPDVALDPSNYTFPATVTIPAGQKIGTFDVTITGNDLGSGRKIFLGIEQIQGIDQNVASFTQQVPDGSPIGTSPVVTGVTMGKIAYTIEELCDFNKVVLSITFDNYPEETAWELYDSTSTVIASGGFDDSGTVITGYAALGFADRSTFATNFCLPAGDYTFVIYDDYGDGMYTSASVQGTYTVKLGDTVLASGGGDFGSFQDTAFTLP